MTEAGSASTEGGATGRPAAHPGVRSQVLELPWVTSDPPELTHVRLEIDSPDPSAYRRGIGWVRWITRALIGLLVVGPAVADDRPPWPLLLPFAAGGIGAILLMEHVLRADARNTRLDPNGSITVTENGIEVHLPAVVREDVLIGWDDVSGIVVDQGRGRGFSYGDVNGHHLLDLPGSGIPPHHRPPLLSALPVRPNVLVLLHRPVPMPWHHPGTGAPMFAGFRGGKPMALPWPGPRPTPAFWVRLRDVGRLGDGAAARHLRPLNAHDVLQLRYELGDLPRPRPSTS